MSRLIVKTLVSKSGRLARRCGRITLTVCTLRSISQRISADTWNTCRMKMTVLDLPLRDLERHPERLIRAIEAEIRFGVGVSFKNRRQHEVLDAD